MVAYRSAILKGTLCYQPEVSTTSGVKVMAHYVNFTKVMTLTLNFIRFQKKKIWKVLDPDYISCKKIRTIGPVVWPVHREPTDKQANRQTDRQTDRGDQYTLQKSTILQSNERIIGDLTCILIWPDLYLWPLAFDLDLWPWPWPSFIL